MHTHISSSLHTHIYIKSKQDVVGGLIIQRLIAVYIYTPLNHFPRRRAAPVENWYCRASKMGGMQWLMMQPSARNNLIKRRRKPLYVHVCAYSREDVTMASRLVVLHGLRVLYIGEIKAAFIAGVYGYIYIIDESWNSRVMMIYRGETSIAICAQDFWEIKEYTYFALRCRQCVCVCVLYMYNLIIFQKICRSPRVG